MLPFLLLSFISVALDAKESEVKIAIIDTGFCLPTSFLFNNNKIKINSSYDSTETLGNLNINLKCSGNFLELPRYHGENVLKTFVKNLKDKKSYQLYPIIVFDNKGQQKLSYWEKTFQYLKKIKPDIVLSAVGLKVSNNELYPSKIDFTWLMSAPRVSPFIKKEDFIFPQILVRKRENIFLVGNFLEDNLFDEGLLYSDAISVFEKDSKEHFNGSSYALSIMAAKVLNHCQIKTAKKLKDCLDRHVKKMDKRIKVFE